MGYWRLPYFVFNFYSHLHVFLLVLFFLSLHIFTSAPIKRQELSAHWPWLKLIEKYKGYRGREDTGGGEEEENEGEGERNNINKFQSGK